MKLPVLWLSFVSGYSEGDIPRMGLRVPFVYHLALLCKSCRGKKVSFVQYQELMTRSLHKNYIPESTLSNILELPLQQEVYNNLYQFAHLHILFFSLCLRFTITLFWLRILNRDYEVQKPVVFQEQKDARKGWLTRLVGRGKLLVMGFWHHLSRSYLLQRMFQKL